MNNFLNFILPSIEHFHFAGYWIAFFAALLETTVGIGLFLPGSTIILFLGALSARGYFDTGDLIWFAVIGAVLGDNINYYLGSRYGSKWVDKDFWFVKAEHIKKTRNFMDTHGAKSVFLGRFIPSVKEIVPFIAGSVQMKKSIFMFWNVLGGIGWGFVWVFTGYIFAQSLNLAELWLSRVGLFVAFLVIIFVILYFLKWLIVRKGKQFWTFAVSLWQSFREALTNNKYVALWVKKHPRFISFWQARLDKKAFSGRTLSAAILSLVYVSALFAGIVEDLITSDPIIAADVRIANLVAVFRSDALTNIFTWITLLGNTQVILGFIAVTVAILSLWRKYCYIIGLFIAVSGSEMLTNLGKLAFHRPRPELAVYAEHSFSFPSGHATIAVAFYGFAGYLLIRFVQSWRKKVNILFATISLIIAIGFSRIYLGEHYISDVWSGYLVGSMWLIIGVSFSEWLMHRRRDSQSDLPTYGARPISLLLIFTAISLYAWFAINYRPPLAQLPVSNEVFVLQATDLFANEQTKYTETMFGDKQEPINFIIIARSDRQLSTVLLEAGWVLTDKADIPSLINSVKALILKSPYPSAPISPSFWNARIQDMSFAKVPGTNWLRNAHHLKIWKTNFLLENGNNIYVGLVNANDGFKWGIVPRVSPDLDSERESLHQDLSHTGKVDSFRKARLVKPQVGNNFMGDPFFSDGKVYIVSL